MANDQISSTASGTQPNHLNQPVRSILAALTPVKVVHVLRGSLNQTSKTMLLAAPRPASLVQGTQVARSRLGNCPEK